MKPPDPSDCTTEYLPALECSSFLRGTHPLHVRVLNDGARIPLRSTKPVGIHSSVSSPYDAHHAPETLALSRDPEQPMEKIVIRGGRTLDGTVHVAGAKNAVLPIMTAFLLAPGTSTLTRVPCLNDVETMAELLRSLGVDVHRDAASLTVDASSITAHEAHYKLVSRMRASFYVLGPLLARLGRARVSLPGGCAWGPRPVDLHLRGLEALGATIDVDHGYVVAEAERLRGTHFHFETSSVGATAQLLMASVLAEGQTVLTNCAIEPEVVALGQCLRAMGGEIRGLGTKTLTIDGVAELRPVTFQNIPDRIEAGTYVIAGAMAGGRVRVADVNPEHLAALVALLRSMDVQITESDDAIEVRGCGRPRAHDVITEVFPGFPTDLQAQIMAFLTRADGTSVITETIYSDRFAHVDELVRLGADITIDGSSAVVVGVPELSGAYVRSKDLRASASLVLAALVAEGETHVTHVHHLDRGYEGMVDKLCGLGAEIRREEDPNGDD